MNFSLSSDSEIKKYLLQILMLVSIPMENWFPVFSNDSSEIMSRPNLRCKAFYIWFPTLLDFLFEEDTVIKSIINEVMIRKINVGPLLDYNSELISLIKQVLGKYSREEQIFLNDRRIQNAHGFLSIYFREKTTIKWFDGIKNTVDSELLLVFYKDMHIKSIEMLNRFVTTENGFNLMKFYSEKLEINNLIKIGEQIGVKIDLKIAQH